MEKIVCRNRDKTRERKDYIDIFRCIGILCMIIGHTPLGGHRMDHYIHAFHMPMFFVVSGYFFRSGKLRKTLMKLFTAYTTLGLFHYATWLGINRGDASIITPLRALFWNCTSLDMPIAGAIWFLPCLAWANLIFEIVDKTGEKVQLILCLVLLCIGIYWERFVGIEMPLAFSASLVAVFFFYVGNAINKRNLERYIEKIPVWTMLIMLILNAALILKTGYVNMRSIVHL